MYLEMWIKLAHMSFLTSQCKSWHTGLSFAKTNDSYRSTSPNELCYAIKPKRLAAFILTLIIWFLSIILWTVVLHYSLNSSICVSSNSFFLFMIWDNVMAYTSIHISIISALHYESIVNDSSLSFIKNSPLNDYI